jgi:copper(I)-binding protein
VAPALVLALAAVLVVTLWRAGEDGDPGSGAATSSDGELRVTDARMALPFDPGQAAAYLTLANDGTVDDVLLGARSDGSTLVMLHRTEVDATGRAVMGGVDGLPVAAGTDLVLEPGGAHLMLDVPSDLAVGDTYPITLLLESGNDVTVDVAVVDPAEVAG